ncbi:MAG: DUF5819 family protein [Bacteroidota bacterium]
MIAVYCFPHPIKNPKIRFINKQYIYPIFHQNWGLFVPAPDTERKLFMRYEKNNGFTDWQDILSQEVIKHKQNRLSGNETRVLLLSNSLIYALNSLDEQPSSVFKAGISNKELKVLQFEVEQYLKSKYQLNGRIGYELLITSSGQQSKAFYLQNLAIN